MKNAKKILFPLLLTLACYTGQSQGTLYFQNRDMAIIPPINAPIAYEGEGPAPAGKINGTNAIVTDSLTWGGINAMCGVYAGAVGASEDQLVLLVPPVGFRAGVAAGYVNVGSTSSRSVPNVPGGAPAVAQLRAWDVGVPGVTSYEDALTISQSRPVYLGKSALITIPALGNNAGSPPSPPAPMTGLTAFSIFYGSVSNPTPPVIVIQPQDQTVPAGSNVLFSCLATGTPPLSYLWYFNGGYPIGSNSTLWLPSVQPADAGEYYVEVSNSAGTVLSSSAFLTVLPATSTNPPSVALVAPSNGAVFDAPYPVYVEATASDPDGWVTQVQFFANSNWLGLTYGPPFALALTNLPYGTLQLTAMAIDNGNNVTISDPVQITYNPRLMQPPIVQLTNPFSGAVFTGSAPLNLGAFATDPDGTISRVEFYIGTNRVGVDYTAPYSIISTNITYGTLQLTAAATDNDGNRTVSEPVYITVNPAPLPTIVTQPANQTVTIGANVTFTVEATSTLPLFYQWYRGSSLLIYQTNSTLSLFNVRTNNAGTYWVVVRNSGGSVTSAPAVLAFIPNTSLPEVYMTSPANGAVYNGPASIYMSASARDPNGFITQVEFLVNGNVVGVATTAPYFIYWPVTNYGSIQLSARATDNDGNVAVCGPITITINQTFPPVITAQPQSHAVMLWTSNVMFSVTATGAPPLFYRWYCNGSPLAGGTNSFYRIPIVQTNHAGTYYVVVSNYTGKVTSSNALLCLMTTTNPTPPSVSVTQPANGAVFYDPFSVYLSAAANDPDGCVTRVEFFIDGTSVGVDATPPYTITRTNLSHGTYQVTAAATDDDGNISVSAPSSFTISPRIPPTIVTQPLSQTALAGSTVTFTVEATGSPQLIYRWFKNGAQFTVTTNGTLTLVNVQTNGIYYVVVSNNAGSATSSNAVLTVIPPNRPPLADAQALSLPEDSSIGIILTGSDPDGDNLAFTVLTAPVHGQLAGTAPNLVYTPEANYYGPDSFTFKVNDGEFDSAVASITIQVTPVNDAPVAIASAGPILQFMSQETEFVILSTNNTSAFVTLDGSRSSDIDSEVLGYYWAQAGAPQAFATEIVATVPLSIGEYVVNLIVSDGTLTGLGTINVSVITPCDAADGAARLMTGSTLPDDLQRELVATLNSACKAFESSRFDRGIGHLQEFQHQVSTDVLPLDAALAEKLITAAQQIIDAWPVTAEATINKAAPLRARRLRR